MKNKWLKHQLLLMKKLDEKLVSEGGRHVIVCDGRAHYCLSLTFKRQSDCACHCANEGRYE